MLSECEMYNQVVVVVVRNKKTIFHNKNICNQMKHSSVLWALYALSESSVPATADETLEK